MYRVESKVLELNSKIMKFIFLSSNIQITTSYRLGSWYIFCQIRTRLHLDPDLKSTFSYDHVLLFISLYYTIKILGALWLYMRHFITFFTWRFSSVYLYILENTSNIITNNLNSRARKNKFWARCWFFVCLPSRHAVFWILDAVGLEPWAGGAAPLLAAGRLLSNPRVLHVRRTAVLWYWLGAVLAPALLTTFPTVYT